MVRIIAECAQGYLRDDKDQSIELAKWLVKGAKSSGADCVKFQLVFADELFTPDYKYYELSKKLEIGFNGWFEVYEEAKRQDIELIFDVFGHKSLSFAEELNVEEIKLHPTDFRNEELLNAVFNSKTIKKIIAGCGGSYYKEIKNTLSFLGDKKKITLLHGFQGYPTPVEENCLNRLEVLKLIASEHSKNVEVGFADHADPNSKDSTHLAAMAIGYGAKTLEKHLTLSKSMKLEDHESALSPDDLKEFVKIIKNISLSKGKNDQTTISYKLPPAEIKYRDACIRHVVTKKELKKGALITSEDVCLKRSSNTNPFTKMEDVIGKTLKTDVPINKSLEITELNYET